MGHGVFWKLSRKGSREDWACLPPPIKNPQDGCNTRVRRGSWVADGESVSVMKDKSLHNEKPQKLKNICEYSRFPPQSVRRALRQTFTLQGRGQGSSRV